jgi:hypothetical protein
MGAPANMKKQERSSMRLLLTSAVLVFMTLAMNAADIAGSWKGSVETEMGTVDVIITFQSGTTLAGNVKAGEYAGPIEKARMDGDRISFEASIEPGRLVFGGTVAGNEMRLNMTGTQGTKYSLVCKRQR